MSRGGGLPPDARSLQCAVCRSLLREPAALPCGHRFCLQCVLAAGPACPLCRRRAGAWLRRAQAKGQLIDEPLWAYIQQHFRDASPEPEGPRLCAPGEIRSEYQAELEKVRTERRLSEEKYMEENEKLIRELQEQEKLETESRNATIEKDEKLARELSVSVTNEASQVPSNSAPSSSNTTPRRKEANIFYEHLEKKPDKCKSQTLDAYFDKSNVHNTDSKTTSTAMTAPSPELVSTAGRCGRFIKQFFNGKLWGVKDESQNGHINSKVEPKQWEPDTLIPGQNKELLVQSGSSKEKNISESIHLTNDNGRKKELSNLDLESESEDSLAPDLCYFKPIHPIEVVRSGGRVVKSFARKELNSSRCNGTDKEVFNKSQTANALEKLRGSTISNVFTNSAFVCLLTVPNSAIKVCEAQIAKPIKKSPKKRRSRASKNSPETSPSNLKTASNKYSNSNNLNGKSNGVIPVISNLMNKKIVNNSTPTKVNPRRSRRNKISQSCVKLRSQESNTISTSAKLKRSLSFNDRRGISVERIKLINMRDQPSQYKSGKKSTAHDYNNGVRDDVEKTIGKMKIFKNGASPRKCDTNGNGKIVENNPRIQQPVNGFRNKTSSNGENKLYCDSSTLLHKADISMVDLDPSIIEEQKYIEKMILQEKKDYDMAKKLQRQLGGEPIFTGYTIRTAAKRQATITELLTPPKKMKI